MAKVAVEAAAGKLSPFFPYCGGGWWNDDDVDDDNDIKVFHPAAMMAIVDDDVTRRARQFPTPFKAMKTKFNVVERCREEGRCDATRNCWLLISGFPSV